MPGPTDPEPALMPRPAGAAPQDPVAAAPSARRATPAMSASYTGEWTLFADYCAATGQPALPTTAAAVAGFLAAVPARPATVSRRLRALAEAHHQAGYASTGLRPDLAASPAHRPGRARQAGGFIAACPTRGWPGGFIGRRDAFLVVLIEVLGQGHDQARRLTPAEITATETGLRIGGALVAGSDDPRACPACAVVRWLEVCDLAGELGRALARTALTAAILPSTTSPHIHLPGHQRWRQVRWLMVGIDQHGRLHDDEPLSTRSIRTRLAAVRACNRDAPTTNLKSKGRIRSR